MLNFKRYVVYSILFSLVTIAYAFAVSLSHWLTYSINVYLLNDYTYSFLFSLLLFLLLEDDMDYFLLLGKLSSYRRFRRYLIKKKIIKVGICILVYWVILTSYFMATDSYFNLVTFTYRCVVIYICLLFVYVILFTVRLKKRRLFLWLSFSVWIVLLFVVILMPNSIFASLSVFSLLYRIDLSNSIKFIPIGVLIIVISNSYITSERFKKICLE